MTITADGGGSNGSRVRLWKVELQNLADEIGLPITVCHFPPGISKWNKIEHRLFSFISMNWRGQPLISHEVILKLIASTRTKSGLTVKTELDSGIYPKGIKITDEEMGPSTSFGTPSMVSGTIPYTLGQDNCCFYIFTNPKRLRSESIL